MRVARPVVIAAVLLAVPAAAQERDAPRKVVVLKPEWGPGVTAAPAGSPWQLDTTAVSDRLAAGLAAVTKRVAVVAPAALAKTAAARGVTLDRDKALALARELGAWRVVVPRVASLSCETFWDEPAFKKKLQRVVKLAVTLEVEVVDPAQERATIAGRIVLERSESLLLDDRTPRGLAPETAASLEDELHRTLLRRALDAVAPARVTAVKGDAVTLDQGTLGALGPGAELDVYKEGEELVDPDTGAVLGRSDVKVGTLRVDEATSSTATAHAIAPEGFVATAGLVGKVGDRAVPAVAKPAETPAPPAEPAPAEKKPRKTL